MFSRCTRGCGYSVLLPSSQIRANSKILHITAFILQRIYSFASE
ncbi:hypothetical protein CSC35_1209 [Enterobacter hormaechei]|nr:hypothetical protein CSC35_1209 [Enterobacter hormaechei]